MIAILQVLITEMARSFAGTVIGWVYIPIRRRRLANRITNLQLQVGDTNLKISKASPEMVQQVLEALDFRERVSAEDLRVADYDKQRDQAEKEIAVYLPDNPRRAKRLINHERLYARIAEDRGVFGGTPELTHRHLAKWVLIIEAWPRLGAALARDPAQIDTLELTSDIQELQSGLASIGIQATEQLFNILHEGVRLSPVLQRLVRFDTAAPGSPEKTVYNDSLSSSEERNKIGIGSDGADSTTSPANAVPDAAVG